MKNQKGITLIALVITIIVLLILAAVAILMIIGDNGILNQASKAKETTEEAEEAQQAALKELEEKVNELVSGNNNTKTLADLKVGDYVKYDTGVTSVGTNGVVTCRVLYPASSEYGLQIISNVVEETDVAFGAESAGVEEAIYSYNSAIEKLNNEALRYLNTDYAIDARSVGSNPANKNAKTTTTDVNYYNLYNVELEGTDTNYVTDWQAMQEANIFNIGTNYWLASRVTTNDVPYYGTDTNAFAFIAFVGNINDGTTTSYGLQCDNILEKENSKVVNIGYKVNGIRSCIKLKTTGIEITGGDGTTEGSAYTLGVVK